MDTQLITIVKKREVIRAQARAMLAKADVESDGNLNPGEQAIFDNLCGQMSAFEAEHARLDDASRIEAGCEPYVKTASENSRETIAAETDAWAGWMPPRPGISLDTMASGPYVGTSWDLPRENVAMKVRAGDDDRRYEAMFGLAADGTHGWDSPNQFLATLARGFADPRQMPMASAMGEGVGSEGGFSVPSQLAKKWLDCSLESEVVRPRCANWPMESDILRIPGWDCSDNSSDTLYGGFSHQWLSENSPATDSEPEMRLVVLAARKLALFTKTSNEVLADGIGLGDQLETAMIKATSWALDYSLLRGTGAGQPRGVITADSRVVVAKEAGQVAGTVIYQNLAKMFSRMAPSSIGNAIWICSPTCIPSLLQLSITVGTAGSHIPVLNESNGEFSMLSRPVLFTEKLPAIGTEGDVVLVDLSQYSFGLRKEMSVEASQHVGWQSDQTGFRVILRCDGTPMWSKVFTPKHGDTLSWCVVLADR